MFSGAHIINFSISLTTRPDRAFAQIGHDLRPLIRFVRRTKNVSRRRHKPNLSRTEKVLFIFISIPTVLDFPPLSRPLDEFYNCPNDFIGYYEDYKLVAVVEMKNEVSSMHIQSLVVDPNYFRKGIARKLISFVLDHYDTLEFTVETGRDNAPARKLYEGFDFILEKSYTATEKIIKVRYRRK